VSRFAALVARDLRIAVGRGGLGLPIIFFLLVATLYPFGVGPDARLLERTAAGVLWVAALLAAILPVERLIASDFEQGVLDQLALRGLSEEIIVLARVVAHWISFGPPLMLAAIPASALLGLGESRLLALETGLLLGTPGLAALSVMVAAITASQKGGAALGGLLMLPLAIPILIFGAGSLNAFAGSALQLLAACSLVAVAITPFAAAAALRAARG
jgi:heme exporter protein B